ncbi:hypothetical protein FACS1894152_5070 [Bacilli bacterium]|nr:hypothetical protein FACS1894152_5070 [Bacilli bacterium]
MANVKNSTGSGLLLKSFVFLVVPKLLIDKLLIGYGYIDKLLISCGYMPLNPENTNSLEKAMNMMMWGGIAGFILWLVLRLYDFGSLAYKLGFMGALHEIYDRFRKTCNKYWLTVKTALLDKALGRKKKSEEKTEEKKLIPDVPTTKLQQNEALMAKEKAKERAKATLKQKANSLPSMTSRKKGLMAKMVGIVKPLKSLIKKQIKKAIKKTG